MISLPFKIKKLLLGVLFSAYLILFTFLWYLPDNKLHVWFLDIGQGDAIFIKTPDNNQILIDGGPESLVLEELGSVMPFGDKSIDLLILSHPHADHIDGLVPILKRYKVRNVLFSGVNYKGFAYNEFLEELSKQEINILIADKELDFRFGEVFFDILYPFDQLLFEDFKNLNNSSIVFKMSYADKSFLFTGDIEEEIETLLIEKHVDLKSDILKVGHHGSSTSSSMDFLLKVRPEIAVIQCGTNNKFGHPEEETLKKLSAVDNKIIYRTDLDGRVEIVVD